MFKKLIAGVWIVVTLLAVPVMAQNEVPFTMMSGYFLKNTVPTPFPSNYFVMPTRDALLARFGIGRTMSPFQEASDDLMSVAIALPADRRQRDIEVLAVEKLNHVMIVHYKVYEGKMRPYSATPVVLFQVDGSGVQEVQFTRDEVSFERVRVDRSI